jgi:hypothetical protein
MLKKTINFYLLLLLNLCLFKSQNLLAQNVGIGTATPHPSAKLDVEDSNRGILVPRISIPNLNTATPVTTPATSLLVYNTNTTSGIGYHYWDGTKWSRLHDDSSSNDNDWNINANGTGLEAALATNNSASGDYAIAAGNADTASGYTAVVAGGEANKATGGSSTVVGGYGNTASHSSTFVGGGAYNSAADNSATVGGGWTNKALGPSSTIGGGQYNRALSNSTTVAGGLQNTASNNAATISGGWNNIASGNYSVVGGGNQDSAVGISSVVIGGLQNKAQGNYSTILGGSVNKAEGHYAIAGGFNNTANSYGETVLGQFATNYIPLSTTSFNTSDRLFNIGNGTNLANRSDAFTILKNGNVGIGTTAPAHKLDIVQNTSFVANFAREDNIPGNEVGIRLGTNNTNHMDKNAYIKAIQGGGINVWDLAFGTSNVSATSVERMRIKTNGNVGIGTTNPTARLEVCGNTKVIGQIQANSSSLSAGLTCSSDKRLKREINEYENALSTIQALSGKAYYWRTEEFTNRGFDQRLKYGFIAQEVEQVLPNLVYEDKEGYKSVDYIQIIPILTNAIQEQQLDLKETKKENNELKSILQKMEERLNTLEAKS